MGKIMLPSEDGYQLSLSFFECEGVHGMEEH